MRGAFYHELFQVLGATAIENASISRKLELYA